MKTKKQTNKTNRISVRCTERDKQILEKRAENLGLGLSEYVKSILFPRNAKNNKKPELIELVVELQDIAVRIDEKYKDDSIQEEVDWIWGKIMEL